MNKKRYIAALTIEFLRGFGVIFTLAILAMSVAGMLVSHFAQDMDGVSTLFALGNGLHYNTILQIAGFALILSFFSVILFSEHVKTKTRFFSRSILFLFITLITSSIFAIIFKWFPPDHLPTWISFVLCTTFCFTISFVLTLLKIKLEGKKYSKLLANYKAKHNNSTH